MSYSRFRRAVGGLLAAGAITAVIPLTMGAASPTHVPNGNLEITGPVTMPSPRTAKGRKQSSPSSPFPGLGATT